MGHLRLIALALLAAAAAPQPAPAAGPPRRICSVSLAGDELLHLLVPPERVACVSSFVDDREVSNVAGVYPPGVPRLTARIEPVLAARPDLVLAAPWNDAAFLDLLRRTGVRSVLLPAPSDFAGIRAQVIDLGRELGAPERAAEVAAEMDRTLGAVDRALAGLPDGSRPRVLSLAHLVVAGSGTTVDALITRAGGRNAAAEISGHRQLSIERILAFDPDVLLLVHGLDPGQALEAYPLLRTTRAAREGRVIVMPARAVTTVTPFLARAADELARRLHPERFANVGPGARAR
ncbi:MAG: ABC transporter substrate-binding protein [Acidobacteria bacterium]|nr:ABC transporter substrate-binding protein [Acidobacteriota bacterium]